VAGEKPNWRHSDGRPYDELEYGQRWFIREGHTRWDLHRAALETSQRKSSRLSRILLGLLRASASRTLRQSRDERRFDDD
jgi:hypothetical protein